MKKTLFAMTALALCGTAVAATYNTSELESKGLLNGWYPGEGPITLNVDASVVFCDVEFDNASPVTFNFQGSNTISSTGYFSLWCPFVINGDDAAKLHWKNELTSSTGEIKVVSLISGFDNTSDFWLSNDGMIFDGLGPSGGTVILGGTQLTYKGAHGYSTLEQVMANPTYFGDNEVMVAKIGDQGGVGQLALIGKITGSPATPEPATATLSLLALAGLASRRRRK